MATELDIKRLDKKITDLSKALANLGKGTDGKDLLIIIAAGDGAKAALGAFDHLMRTPAARPSEARSAVPAA